MKINRLCKYLTTCKLSSLKYIFYNALQIFPFSLTSPHNCVETTILHICNVSSALADDKESFLLKFLVTII